MAKKAIRKTAVKKVDDRAMLIKEIEKQLNGLPLIDRIKQSRELKNGKLNLVRLIK